MKPSPNRIVGIVVGACYMLLGMLGFTATAAVDFFAPEGGLLLGLFQVNGLHNVVHIVIGVALIAGGLRNVAIARPVNAIVGAICLVLGLAGLFLVGTALNVLALNVADNALHFGTAVVLLAVGLGADTVAVPE